MHGNFNVVPFTEHVSMSTFVLFAHICEFSYNKVVQAGNHLATSKEITAHSAYNVFS